MKIGMDLSARQTMGLKQVLAPRMIQSMEILQLPITALQERIEKELQENPVLELKDGSQVPDTAEAESDAEAEAEGAEPGSNGTAPADEINSDTPLKHDSQDAGPELEFKRLEALDREWEGAFSEDEHRPSRAALDELGDKKLDAMQNIVERPQSLQDHLAEQLSDLDLTPEDCELALHIISFIDRTGYVGRRNDRDAFLPASLLEIASTFVPPATPE